MIKLFQKFLQPHQAPPAEEPGRIRALELELEEKSRSLLQLRDDLQRERARGADAAEERASSARRRLLEDIASPLVQLLTQSHLSEDLGREIASKDVLRVVRSLVRVLEDTGLQIQDVPGTRCPFDPNRHEPVGSATSPSAGSPVEVKFPGLAYRDQIIRKAGVVPA